MFNRQILIWIFTLLFTPVFTQNRDIAHYMDDNGRSSAKDIIKTNLSSFFVAHIPLIWEHRFNYTLSLQSGFGILTNQFFKPVYTPTYSVDDVKMDKSLQGGYSFLLAPAFYAKGFESFHLELPFTYRHYNKKAVAYDIYCTVGRQWFLTSKIALDIDVGVGVSFEKSLNGVSYIYDPEINSEHKSGGEGIRMVIPLALKIGYIL